MRRLKTNKTKILHQSRLKIFVQNPPFEDKSSEANLQPGDEIVIPQYDLYISSWEVRFDYKLFEPRKYSGPDTATRLPTDAASGGVDYYVTEDNESSSAKSSERCNHPQLY